VVLSRNTEGVFGVPEPGDRFGYAIVDDGNATFVGVPGARVNAEDGAGAVYGLGRRTSAWRLSHVYTQNSPGIPDVAQAGDHFGAALAAGAFTDCATLSGTPREASNLAIGSPGEDSGSIHDFGTVTIVPVGQPTSSSLCDRAFYEGTRGRLGSLPESGDLFGSALARVPAPFDPSTFGEGVLPDRLLVGIPGEDAGAVTDAGGVIMTKLQLSSTPMISGTSYSDTVGPQAHDRYGQVLAH
jgi:hypothetical protein